MANYISKWLVLGPIFSAFHQTPHSPGDSHPTAAEIIADIDDSPLSPQQITFSAASSPRAGDAVCYYSRLFPKKTCSWCELEFNGLEWGNVADVGDDIHRKLGTADFRDKHHALAFFLCYVDSTDERTAKLLIRSDDSIRVWLNGTELESLRYEGEREISAAETGADVPLRKGVNILMAAVSETHFEWGFSARFDSDDGLSFSTSWPPSPVHLLPPGKEIKRSLGDVSSEFAVFERDQVLTHDQLNSISDYLDRQERLTRVNLLGVGIAQGLQVSSRAGSISVTGGVGVTTDGDILCFPSERTFTHFRRYDALRPRYSSFFENRNIDGKMFPVFELVVQGEASRAEVYPLADFAAVAGKGKKPEEMVALLFRESFVTDMDICSATDCDNLGQTCVNSQKLLLIDPADAALLKTDGKLPRVSDVAASLHEIVPQRVIVGTSTTSFSLLTESYQHACNSLHTDVTAFLARIPVALPSLLPDNLPPDRGSAWLESLLKKKTQVIPKQLQYYHGFLSDLAETCNELREQLLDATACCCPAPDAFPKHLLLGIAASPPSGSTAAKTAQEYRTTFYPSPFLGAGSDNLMHAKFLLKKIDTMIATYDVASSGPITITPGMSAAQSLEERAIPFYYRSGGENVIEDAWNYRVHRRGASVVDDRYCIDDKTGDAAAVGGAFPIGRFPFFRIEGHLGRRVEDVQQRIEKAILTFALPFAVHAVKIGTGIGDLHRKRPLRYGDLHRLHYMFRQDLNHQLDEMVTFSREFKGKVEAQKPTLNKGSVENLTKVASEHPAAIETKAASVIGKVAPRKYSDYKKAGKWHEELNSAVESAGRLKSVAAENIQERFVTPFDSVITNSQFKWVGWLDTLIGEKERKEDEKLLLVHFVTESYGIDAACGVPRGGTFILAYTVDPATKEKIVVADFMLPYLFVEPGEVERKEPPLKKFPRPDFITKEAIVLADPLRDAVENKVMEEVVKQKVSIGNEYMATFRDYVSVADKTMSGYNRAADAKADAVAEDISRQSKEAAAIEDDAERAQKYASVMKTYMSSPLLVNGTVLSSFMEFTEQVKNISPEAKKTLSESVDTLADQAVKNLVKSKLGL